MASLPARGDVADFLAENAPKLAETFRAMGS
jgi:hypothetical protein